MTKGIHYTDKELDSMHELVKLEAVFTGAEIRKLIEDIRTARKRAEDNSCTLCLLMSIVICLLLVFFLIINLILW